MLWSEEHYFRVYTRDTEEYTSWSEETRLVFLELGRKADADGVVMFRSQAGLARLLRLREETVRIGLKQLTEESAEGPPYAELIEGGVIVRNHVEAQEAKRSDVQRKRDQRKRDNRAARVTSRKPPDEVSREVTPCDEQSQYVTGCHSYSALLGSALQRESPERSRDPGAPEPHPAPEQEPVADLQTQDEEPEPAATRLVASERGGEPPRSEPSQAGDRDARAVVALFGLKLEDLDERARGWLDHRLAMEGAAACLRAPLAQHHPRRIADGYLGFPTIFKSAEVFRVALQIVDQAIASGAAWLPSDRPGRPRAPPASTAAPCSCGCGEKAYACKRAEPLTPEAARCKADLEARYVDPKPKKKPQEAA